MKIKALAILLALSLSNARLATFASVGAPAAPNSTIAPNTTPKEDLPLRATINNVDPNTAMNEIDELTRQILLKEVQLERFNLHYSMEVAKQGRWKGWRYAGFQEINAGMGLAGSIIGTANRGSHLRSPTRVWVVVQETANFVPMIGSIIGASAAALEFSINEYHDLQATHKGFSPKAARSYVMGLRSDIDQLLAKRDALMKIEESAPTLTGYARIDETEGKLLQDLRDQGILEFERFHVGARKLLAFQQAQYFFDFSKYTLNAIGYDFAYLSLHRHRRVWNYRAGVMWDIAGPIYMGAPILSRIIGKGVGEMHKHFLKPLTKDIEGHTVQTLESDYKSLDRLFQDTSTAPLTNQADADRHEIYKLQNDKFQNEIAAGLKQNAKAKLTATQNVGAGLFVGGLKTAQGIVFTIPGYYHDYNSKTKRAARVTNSDLFVGSVLGLPAGAFSMLDTLRIQVRGEINRHKQMKAGQLPKQVAATRLKELDAIEAKLSKPAG